MDAHDDGDGDGGLAIMMGLTLTIMASSVLLKAYRVFALKLRRNSASSTTPAAPSTQNPEPWPLIFRSSGRAGPLLILLLILLLFSLLLLLLLLVLILLLLLPELLGF